MTSLANIRGEYGATDYLAGTAAGGEDHHRASTPTAAAVGHRRGLRLLCVDTGGWIRIAYADDDPVDCAAVVRRRVGFLLRNLHIIPTYSLVECNCECVASASPCGARPGDGRGRLMAAASSNGGGDGRKRGGGGKERRNNQIEAMAAAGGNNKHRRSTAEMDDGV